MGLPPKSFPKENYLRKHVLSFPKENCLRKHVLGFPSYCCAQQNHRMLRIAAAFAAEVIAGDVLYLLAGNYA